ncbi:MAG: hypothetical protein JWL86_4491 [Rhizobium sp.]|nr:hypothetical protein [Rhizobium sp.]
MRKFLGAFVLLLIGLWFVGSMPNKSSAPAPDIRNAAPADVAKTSAGELFRMYDTNEVATDSSLKGRIVEVSGTVQGINKDFLDNLYVSLVTPNQFMSANMHVPKSEEQKLIQMRKGQSVVFRCAKMKRWAGAPSGDDCLVMQ